MLSGNLPEHTSHLAYFRQAVTQAAAALSAQSALPMSPDRVQKAMDLVLAGAVEAHEDGVYTVRSGNHTYEILGECTCQDSQHRSRYCKHYLVTMLWKGAQERMHPVNGNGVRNGGNENRYGHTWVDAVKANPPVNGTNPPAIPDAGDTHHWTDVLAPICHTVKYVVDGIEHCTVIRGDDMDEVMGQIKALTATIKKGREAETVPNRGSLR